MGSGEVWRGMKRDVVDPGGPAAASREGAAVHGPELLSAARPARPSSPGRVGAGRGGAGLGMPSVVWRGVVGRGMAGRGRAGLAGRGGTRPARLNVGR